MRVTNCRPSQLMIAANSKSHFTIIDTETMRPHLFEGLKVIDVALTGLSQLAVVVYRVDIVETISTVCTGNVCVKNGFRFHL